MSKKNRGKAGNLPPRPQPANLANPQAKAQSQAKVAQQNFERYIQSLVDAAANEAADQAVNAYKQQQAALQRAEENRIKREQNRQEKAALQEQVRYEGQLIVCRFLAIGLAVAVVAGVAIL